jgi:Flp pilus assembly protein TadD
MDHYGSDDLQDHFAPLLETLERFIDEYPSDAQAQKQLEDAIDRINMLIEESQDDSDKESDEGYIYDERDSVVESERETRDIFDDVDK